MDPVRHSMFDQLYTILLNKSTAVWPIFHPYPFYTSYWNVPLNHAYFADIKSAKKFIFNVLLDLLYSGRFDLETQHDLYKVLSVWHNVANDIICAPYYARSEYAALTCNAEHVIAIHHFVIAFLTDLMSS